MADEDTPPQQVQKDAAELWKLICKWSAVAEQGRSRYYGTHGELFGNDVLKEALAEANGESTGSIVLRPVVDDVTNALIINATPVTVVKSVQQQVDEMLPKPGQQTAQDPQEATDELAQPESAVAQDGEDAPTKALKEQQQAQFQPQPPTEEELLQRRLDLEMRNFWDENEFDDMVPDVHAMAGRDGNAYLLKWKIPSEDADPDDEDAPQVVVYFPLTAKEAAVAYDGYRRVKFAGRFYTENGATTMLIIYPGGVCSTVRAKGILEEGTDQGNSPKVWSEIVEDKVPHNVGKKFPMRHIRNSRPYGFPEHEAGYAYQDAITKLDHEMASISDWNTVKPRLGLASVSKVEQKSAVGLDLPTADRLLGDQSYDVTQQPGTGVDKDGKPNRVAEPGVTKITRPKNGDLILVPDVGEIVELSAGDVTAYIDVVKHKIERISSVCMVGMFMMIGSAVAPSGEAFRRSLILNLRKKKNRKTSYGNVWSRFFSDELSERVGIEVKVSIEWDDSETIDPVEYWGNIAPAQALRGVPDSRLLTAGGFEAAEAQQWEQDAEKRKTLDFARQQLSLQQKAQKNDMSADATATV